MSVLIQCDRCERIVSTFDAKRWELMDTSDLRIGERSTIDLCRECSTDLVAFLDPPKGGMS